MRLRTEYQMALDSQEVAIRDAHRRAKEAGLAPDEYEVVLKLPLGPGMPWRAEFTKILVNPENSRSHEAP